MEVKEVLVRFGVPVRKTSGIWSTGVQMWGQLVVEDDLEKLLGGCSGDTRGSHFLNPKKQHKEGTKAA